MVSGNPAWLAALAIFAPIIASFGVLWLSNRQQTSNLRAQHELSLEKEKIAAVVSKAEEVYADVQKRKKHLEASSFKHMAFFVQCSSKEQFVKKILEDNKPIEFDLVRLDLNFGAYFPELKSQYRNAEALIHSCGAIQSEMIEKFDMRKEEKRELNGRLLKAQQNAVQSLDALSHALAERISSILSIEPKWNLEVVNENTNAA